MDQDRAKRKLTAIFSADVVGYSRLMEADEAWTIQSLEENKQLISKLIEEYEGRVIDAPGDNLLAEFSSVINAVECAVKIQQELKKKNDHLIESNRMHFRIGINLGDVVEEDGRIYGNGVNIAARLEGLTDPGGICISRRTYDHVKTRLDLGYEYLGEHNVKNISEPVRVYRVLMGSENAGKVIGEKKASRMVSRRLAVTTFIALIIIAAGSLIWNIYSNQSRKIEQASEPEQAPAVVNEEETPKTIAVIPFVNLSPDPDQEYFVDGLSEELLNCLSKISGLRVTSRTSSFVFKDSDKKLQEIANDLGVEHILEGSVRKSGSEIRITAQLIRAADDAHLWSEAYDRELKDIFTVQEDIAIAVANELKAALGIGKSIKKLRGTENLEAYELYLIGQGQFQIGVGYIKPALESIDAAIALDPEFALAWAFKSLLHYYIVVFGPVSKADAEQDAALSAALKAIELEPDLADGYNSLGYIQTSRGEFIEAESSYNKGLELSNDNFKYIYNHYFAVGYFEKALAILEEMVRKDPLNEELLGCYLSVLGLTGNMQRVEEEYARGMELFADEWVWGDVNIINLRLGTDHSMLLDSLRKINPNFETLIHHLESPEDGVAELHRMYDDIQDSKEIRGLSSKDFSTISMLAAYFGDLEFSMDALENFVSINSFGVHIVWYPIMREVRQTPRFKEFVREIGLVDYWEKFGWPDICQPMGDGDFVCD